MEQTNTEKVMDTSTEPVDPTQAKYRVNWKLELRLKRRKKEKGLTRGLFVLRATAYNYCGTEVDHWLREIRIMEKQTLFRKKRTFHETSLTKSYYRKEEFDSHLQAPFPFCEVFPKVAEQMGELLAQPTGDPSIENPGYSEFRVDDAQFQRDVDRYCNKGNLLMDIIAGYAKLRNRLSGREKY